MTHETSLTLAEAESLLARIATQRSYSVGAENGSAAEYARRYLANHYPSGRCESCGALTLPGSQDGPLPCHAR